MNNLSIAGNHHQYILSPQKRNRDTLTALFFLIPTLVFFFIFIIYPIIQSLYYSFFNWKGFGPAVNFVGFRNYEKILTDSVFAKAVANGLLIVVLSLIVQLPISIALAIMVRNDMPGRSFFRTIFFMPFVFLNPLPVLSGSVCSSRTHRSVKMRSDIDPRRAKPLSFWVTQIRS